MEYIKRFEKFPANDRDFIIYIYRDNNNDRLQLDAHEVINDKRKEPPLLTNYVPMNGKFNLPPEGYADYSNSLAKLKQFIRILASPDFENKDIDAPIPGFAKEEEKNEG